MDDVNNPNEPATPHNRDFKKKLLAAIINEFNSSDYADHSLTVGDVATAMRDIRRNDTQCDDL